MLHERNLCARFIIEWYRFLKNREITCLLDICHSTEDQPAWIIIETTTDVIVTMLCKRLILVIATTVRELGRSDVDDTFTSTTWNLMYEANEILIRITEAHATTYTTLEETCRTREVERNHTLILAPDINHTVQTLIIRLDNILVKQSIPHLSKFCKCSINSLNGRELFDKCLSLRLVYECHVRIL